MKYFFIIIVAGISNIFAQNFWQSNEYIQNHGNGGTPYAMAYAKSGNLIVGLSDIIFTSTDDGNSFIKTGFIGHGDILSLAADTKNGFIYAGTRSSPGGIYRSNDNGISWNPVGLSGMTITDIVVDTGGAVIASSTSNSTGELFLSTNSGSNWITKLGPSYYTVYCLGKDKKNNLYAGTSDPNIFGAIILKSGDRGDSWGVLHNFGEQSNNVYGIGTDTNGNIYACTSSKVFRTTDSGTNWNEIFSQVTPGLMKTPFAFNKYNHVFVGFDGQGVFRSIDGGEHFVPLNSGLWSQYLISFTVKDSIIFAGTRSSNMIHKGFSIPQPNSPTLFYPLNGSVCIPLITTCKWEKSIYSDNYRIQVSTDSGFTIITIDSSAIVDTLFISPSGKLFANTKYYWRVNANNSGGTSSWSTIGNFTTTTVLPIPSLISPHDTASNQSITAALSWNNVIGAKSYQLQLAKDIGFNQRIIDSTGIIDTLFKIISGKLNYSTKYYWRVMGFDQCGSGPWSIPRSFTTMESQIPPAPTIISPGNAQIGLKYPITLKWIDSSNTAVSYQLQLSDTINFMTLVIDSAGLKSPQYIINSGLSNLKFYFWKVNSKNVQGNVSQWSNIFSFKTDTPVNVQLTSFSALVNGNDISLLWVTATETNNAGFYIEKWTNLGTFREIEFIKGKGTTTENNSYVFTDKNLTPGKYIYRLKQIDFDGRTNYSNEVTAEIRIPLVERLDQNYPNPFNPSTIIRYSLTNDSFVKLIIYNTVGENVYQLVSKVQDAGYHEINFNASQLSSGIYFYTLQTNSIDGKQHFTATKKMVLLK
jgi:photosystem II stability/assembly factor-like uncharacterized protein